MNKAAREIPSLFMDGCSMTVWGNLSHHSIRCCDLHPAVAVHVHGCGHCSRLLHECLGPKKSGLICCLFLQSTISSFSMPASTCGTSCHGLTLTLVPAACSSGRRQDYQQEKAVGGESVSGLIDQHGWQHTECISEYL